MNNSFDLRAKVHRNLHKRFGVNATYKTTEAPDGVPVTVKLNLSVETFDSGLNYIGNEDQIVLLLSDIPNPKKKQIISVSGTDYYLVRKLKDDGIRQVWSVTSDR